MTKSGLAIGVAIVTAVTLNAQTDAVRPFKVHVPDADVAEGKPLLVPVK
jgi:hypothetical protein